jgi:hypothetical protein
MKQYQIETGNYEKIAKGKSMIESAINIFKKFPPKSASLLTRMRTFKHQNTKEDNWYYIDTKTLLRKAGYKIRL